MLEAEIQRLRQEVTRLKDRLEKSVCPSSLLPSFSLVASPPVNRTPTPVLPPQPRLSPLWRSVSPRLGRPPIPVVAALVVRLVTLPRLPLPERKREGDSAVKGVEVGMKSDWFVLLLIVNRIYCLWEKSLAKPKRDFAHTQRTRVSYSWHH